MSNAKMSHVAIPLKLSTCYVKNIKTLKRFSLQINIQVFTPSLSVTAHLEMFFSLSAYIPLICLCLLPLQCLLSLPYQMSSCRQRAGTAYRCVHEGTVMERHPLAANTDLRQHAAHDCLTGTCSLPCKKQIQTVFSSSMQFHALTSRNLNTRTEANLNQ